MKKVSVVLLMLALIWTSQAHAFGLGGLGSSGGGGSVDTGKLNERGAALILKIGVATILMGDAQVEMLNAVGSEQSAQKLKAALDDLKAHKGDPEKTKVAINATNDASKELKEMDLNAKMDKSKANKAVAFAFLNFGGAALLDGWAVKDGEALLKSISDAGPSAAMSLRSAIEAAKFVAETLPGQISDMAALSKSLIDYATTNKIALPSQKDIDKKADDLKG